MSQEVAQEIQSVIAELRKRFDLLLKKGEDTIPADLVRTTYVVVSCPCLTVWLAHDG